MSTLIFILIAVGLAKFFQTLPRYDDAQAWLETTWTHGKPLNCWVCLIGWCAIGWSILHPAATLIENAGNVLAAIGLGSTIMQRLEPMIPLLPPIEVEDAPGEDPP